MSAIPEEDGALVYAQIQGGHGSHHECLRLAIEPKFGPVLRMGFVPPLRAGENPVMAFDAARLRELAAAALRMADEWEAVHDGR